MAIKIGQVRYSTNGNYLTRINDFTISELPDSSENNKVFKNTILNTPLQAGVTYYLRAAIQRIDANEIMGNGVGDNDAHRQIIDVKIINETNNFSQTILESYTIDPYATGAASNEYNNETHFLQWCQDCININTININDDDYEGAMDYLVNLQEKHNALKPVDNTTQDNNYVNIADQTLELIFTPYRACTGILFQLRRVGYDYLADEQRQIEFATTNNEADIDLAIVNNILPTTVADKIGLQTAPGSLIVINGEGLRVGRSGVLELNCDIPISSIGLAAPHLQVKNFLLDYIYTE